MYRILFLSDGDVVTVLQAHTARDDDEITVNVNDKVTVTEKDESGWWRGRLKDKEGLFPSSCVQQQQKKQEQSVSTRLTETEHGQFDRETTTG